MEQEKKEVTMDQYHLLLNKDLKGFSSNVDTLFEIIGKLGAENETLKKENADLKFKLEGLEK